MIKETHIIRGTIYSLEELAEISDGVRVREKEEKEMTKAMEKMVGRIYEELTKWCTERGVVYEYHYSTDDGESCTFITSDTTLTVNHVENRDPEQFSRYVKSVLFGVDDIIIDHLKAQVDDLKKEIVSKDDCIAYLQCKLNYMGGDAVSRKSLSNQIGQLEEEIESKDAYIGSLEHEDKEKAKDIEYLENKVKELEKNLNTAADKIVQLKCANTSLKEQINILKCALNKEREGYGELKDQYDDKCKAFINMCKLYDTEVTKRMKAEDDINNLKAGRHDDVVDVTRYLVVLGKKKRAEEKIRSLKSQVEICEAVVKNLADQNESFKKQVDALVKEKLKILAEDDATMDILKKKNATLQYKVDALQNDVKDLTSSYKKELEKKDKENLDLDNSVKDMWATLRSLKKDNVGLKDANNFLNIKLEKRDEIIEALKNDNDKAEAKIEELLEKNYDLDNHVKNLVAQVEILEREKNELTNEYSDLVKVKEFVKDDTLKDIKERIAWILTHMNIAETEADKRFKKLEEAGGRTIGIDLNIGKIIKDVKERITKLEEAQPKKAKTSKKSQKSDLS